ncbi:hypothetical protein Cni_G04979 [Canna indica]|uniref:RRM domain-containing protein n=1 Tax=Canna indica TaxID=4628 RepID=A0AAQ3JWD8_9LILI|nr:hypothetical protein Cni_G04979 [Canna indica]
MLGPKSMATKKRKVDQEDELLLPPTAPNHAIDPHLHNQPVVYTPAPAPASDDDDGGEEEDDDVGKLLDPLSREQLVSLLLTAASSNPATLSEIRLMADQDPAYRKLFVHGLGWDTTADGLRAAYASYGDIDDCRVIVDKASGRSKGYGFVLFRHRSSARRALRRPQKLIDNRMTSCQLASSGPSAPPSGHHHNPGPQHHQNHNPNPAPSSHQDNISRKIYVGNVHSDVDGSRLLAFFSQYGEVEEGPIGFDRHTGKPKGYALFVYKTVDGAVRALEEPSKNFEGHLLYCQRATDNKSKTAPTQNTAAPPNMAPNTGTVNGSGFGTSSDIGLAQQAAMLGQGLLGMGGAQTFGQGMQPNAAMLALLAAAGQNPAAFGITPAMLASLNPAFAAAFGASGNQQTVPPQAVPQVAQVPNYGMGNTAYQGPPGFQGAPGFQGSPGFQGPPGFQGTQTVAQQGGGGSNSYQGVPTGQGPMSRPPTGPMGGYGPL